MKKKYIRPEAKVIELELSMIIAASTSDTLNWDGGDGTKTKVMNDTEADESVWKYL